MLRLPNETFFAPNCDPNDLFRKYIFPLYQLDNYIGLTCFAVKLVRWFLLPPWCPVLLAVLPSSAIMLLI